MIHHLTNWMGDDGFLVSCESKIRRHNPEGDTLFFNGKVTKLSDDEDGFGLVEIQHEARTHTNELSILGSGTVRLPKRGL
mgnify:FL=1